MQKKQSSNSKKNIGKIQKMFKDKNRKRGHSEEENYQEGLWQENYLDSQIKKYDEEYQTRLERNWRKWKRERARGQRTMETIKKKEKEIEQENLGIKEWTEEDNNEMGNICDLYYKL